MLANTHSLELVHHDCLDGPNPNGTSNDNKTTEFLEQCSSSKLALLEATRDVIAAVLDLDAGEHRCRSIRFPAHPLHKGQ